MSQGSKPSKKEHFTNNLQEKQKQSTSQVQSIMYNAHKREELIQTDMQEQQTQLLQRVKLHKNKKKEHQELQKIEVNSDKQENEDAVQNTMASKFSIWKHFLSGAMKTINEDEDFEQEKNKKAEQRDKSIKMLKHASVELDEMVTRFNKKSDNNKEQEKEHKPHQKQNIDKEALLAFKKKYSNCIIQNLETLGLEKQETRIADLFSGKFFSIKK